MDMIGVGDEVSWKSQAGGMVKKKTGSVFQIVPAMEGAEVTRGDFSIEFDLPAKPRNHVSYLVLVQDVRKGRPGLYWPAAAKLTLVKGKAPAEPIKASPVEKTGSLPGTDHTRGPLDKACENYLDQSVAVKREKDKLALMGEGILSAMQKEGRKKLTLESSEGESTRFEVLPTGFHLKVVKAKG